MASNGISLNGGQTSVAAIPTMWDVAYQGLSLAPRQQTQTMSALVPEIYGATVQPAQFLNTGLIDPAQVLANQQIPTLYEMEPGLYNDQSQVTVRVTPNVSTGVSADTSTINATTGFGLVGGGTDTGETTDTGFGLDGGGGGTTTDPIPQWMLNRIPNCFEQGPTPTTSIEDAIAFLNNANLMWSQCIGQCNAILSDPNLVPIHPIATNLANSSEQQIGVNNAMIARLRFVGAEDGDGNGGGDTTDSTPPQQYVPPPNDNDILGTPAQDGMVNVAPPPWWVQDKYRDPGWLPPEGWGREVVPPITKDREDIPPDPQICGPDVSRWFVAELDRQVAFIQSSAMEQMLDEAAAEIAPVIGDVAATTVGTTRELWRFLAWALSVQYNHRFDKYVNSCPTSECRGTVSFFRRCIPDYQLENLIVGAVAAKIGYSREFTLIGIEYAAILTGMVPSIAAGGGVSATLAMIGSSWPVIVAMIPIATAYSILYKSETRDQAAAVALGWDIVDHIARSPRGKWSVGWVDAVLRDSDLTLLNSGDRLISRRARKCKPCTKQVSVKHRPAKRFPGKGA